MYDKQVFLSFCEHLSGLLKAGLPLRDALDILGESTGCGRKQTSLSARVSSFMKKGYSFSSAVSVNGLVRVEERVCSLIAAAERAGSLCEMLSFIARTETERQTFVSKIAASCVYPLLITVLAGTGSFFLVRNSSSFGFKAVPAGVFSGLVVSVIFITAFLCLFFYAARKTGTENPQFFFFNSLSFFLSCGFDLKRALALVSIAGGLKNASLCSVLLRKLSLGIPFSKSLCEDGRFSTEAIALVCLAEKSGRLAEACQTVAARITDAEKRKRVRFIRFGEPVLLAAVGIYVLVLSQNVILPFITNFDCLI